MINNKALIIVTSSALLVMSLMLMMTRDNAPPVDKPTAEVTSSTSLNNKAQHSPTSVVSQEQPSSAIPIDPLIKEISVIFNEEGKVDYIKNDDGLVILEIDNDPSSLSYEKPLAAYEHRRGRVTSKTSYTYLDNGEVYRSTLDIAYNDDGSISDYRRRHH